MEDYITISDDEDVQLIAHVVNLEPVLIDLTKGDEASYSHSQSQQQQQQQQRPSAPPQQRYSPPAKSPTQSPSPSTPLSSLSPSPSPPQQPSPPLVQQRPPLVQQQQQQQQTPPLSQQQQQQTPPLSQQQSPPTPQEQPPSQPQEQSQPQPQPPQHEKLIVSDRELMMAQKELGNEKYKHNLFDDAIRIYKRANELAKKLGDNEMSAILHFNLAMTYYKVGSFDQAADECANAVKINDNYIKAHLKRAEIYQRQCKFDDAVICYEHICELDSTNQDYAILLNHAKEAAKRTKKKDYYQCLGLNSNFTREDLKRAYRQQALSHHPDRHSDADIVTRRIQEKHFKEASEAHTFIQLRLGYRL